MANPNGNNGNLRSWKKGQSGNPKGREPILDREIREAFRRDKWGTRKLISEFLWMTKTALKERLQNPEAPNLEIVLGQCIERGVREADAVKFKALLEMAYGPMVEKDYLDELTEEDREAIELYRRWKKAQETKAD